MKYDVIIIGAGPGGYTLAIQLAQHQKNVLLIEKDRYGGSCVNRGCIPTKMLVKHARLLSELKNIERYSIKLENISFDYNNIHKNVMQVSVKLNEAIKGQLTAFTNLKLVSGTAKLIDKHLVRVGNDQYEGETIVIATGATSRLLKIKGAEELRNRNKLITSTAGLKLEKLPQSITFVGGGIIGVEFANIFASLGVEVLMLEMQPTFLANLDQEIVNHLKNSLEQKKIKIMTGVTVNEFTEDGSLLYTLDDKQQRVQSDLYFESIGREVVHDAYHDLNWLERNERGNLKVNAYLQTNEPNIYVLGDSLGTVQLSSVAYKSADLITNHIVNKKAQPLNYRVIPACVYGPKDFAFLGESEQNLLDRNANFKKIVIPVGKLPRAHAEIDAQEGILKILIDNQTTKILGAWIYLQDGSYIINQIAQAMANDLTAAQIVKIPFTHPTLNEALYYALRNYSS